MTSTSFISTAQPVPVSINGSTLLASPKEFSTGSVGFYLNGKVPVQVGGQTFLMQVSGNLVAVGSKEWKR